MSNILKNKGNIITGGSGVQHQVFFGAWANVGVVKILKKSIVQAREHN